MQAQRGEPTHPILGIPLVLSGSKIYLKSTVQPLDSAVNTSLSVRPVWVKKAGEVLTGAAHLRRLDI